MSKRMWLAWAGLALAAMLLASPDAKATEFPGYGGDPHIPIASQGFCPGGGFLQIRFGVLKGYCDGVDYPDGSFWHQVPGAGSPYAANMITTCRFHTGLWLQEAPDGCVEKG